MMTTLEKELLAALKEDHNHFDNCARYTWIDSKIPCKTCDLIAKAEAQEAGDER